MKKIIFAFILLSSTALGDDWVRITDISSIKGVYNDKSLPYMQVWVDRIEHGKKSNTPYNIRFRGHRGLIEGGCGFYDSGFAVCELHDKDHRDPKSPMRKETKVLFMKNKDKIKLIVEASGSWEFSYSDRKDND